ncbi:MAG: GTP cyclohydrolase I FolE [Candidatus Thorarchaeota archaeon]
MALNKNKTDAVLGQEIHEHLLELGVETPFAAREAMNEDLMVELIGKNVQSTMTVLGLDLENDSLQDTPKRVAKMYVDETFYGLRIENFPKITVVENEFNYDEMLVEKNINIMSVCEHHFVGIVGKATIGYIPNGKVIGLSKLNRVAEYFARRPQVQERLTAQIYHALCYILKTEQVAVVIDADHFCVKSRGIEDTGSSTITSKLGGGFKGDPATRAEFMALARDYK